MGEIVEPHSIEAEQALLGAILVNNDAWSRVAGTVKAQHFYEPIHARIYELCEETILGGRLATPITLKPKLPADLDIAGLSGIQYMARLSAEATTILNAPDYAQTVREAWAARQVIEAARAVAAEVSAPDANVKGSIAAALTDLDEIRAALDDRRLARQHIGDIASGVLKRMDAIRDGTLEPGISTGLKDLDRAIGGLQPGRLVVIAGRPGMGKSIAGANIARAVASNGYGCALHSLEMAGEEIGSRLISDAAFTIDAPIASRWIFEGVLNARQRDAVERAAETIAGLPLTIDTSPSLSVGEIVARARATADAMKARGHRLSALVIDYLKFIRASDRYRGNRVYEIGEITAGLKALAKDMGICVVLLCQLNRAVETRADKRPELSDLRESGDIEADADVVLLLFREAYYLRDKTDPDSMAKLMDCANLLEIVIAKSRGGATGTVRAYCDPAASVVRDWRGPQ